MKDMRERLFIATFSSGAIDSIRENRLNIEINHTCISEDLDPENRSSLLASIKSDIQESGAHRVIVHGPFTELYPAAIDYKAVEFAMERLEQGYQAASAAGAEAMVVHSGYIPFIYFRRKNLRSFGRNSWRTSLRIFASMWKTSWRASLICWLI